MITQFEEQILFSPLPGKVKKAGLSIEIKMHDIICVKLLKVV